MRMSRDDEPHEGARDAVNGDSTKGLIARRFIDVWENCSRPASGWQIGGAARPLSTTAWPLAQ